MYAIADHGGLARCDMANLNRPLRRELHVIRRVGVSRPDLGAVRFLSTPVRALAELCLGRGRPFVQARGHGTNVFELMTDPAGHIVYSDYLFDRV
jgi:hypothetical protein